MTRVIDGSQVQRPSALAVSDEEIAASAASSPERRRPRLLRLWIDQRVV